MQCAGLTTGVNDRAIQHGARETCGGTEAVECNMTNENTLAMNGNE